MTERERLIEILRSMPPLNINIGGRLNGKRLMTMQHIADHLLANGVIVPPCKVGDAVYLPWNYNDVEGVACLTVTRIVISDACSYVRTDMQSDDRGYLYKYNFGQLYFSDFGKIVFLTQAEADKALAERVQK